MPDVSIDDLPQLQLQGAEPPPPHVTNIKVENGKGDVLYNGPRPDDGRLTANPSPAQLDGTMKVTRTFSDGSATEQTLTYDAGKPVKIGYREITNEYYVDTENPPGKPKFFGALNPYYEFRNRPDAPLIRRDIGGQTESVFKGNNDNDNPGFSGSIGMKFDYPLFGLGKSWGVQLDGKYYSSSSQTDIDSIPANGGTLGIFGPFAGGGISTANDISNLRYNSRFWDWSVGASLTKDCMLDSWDEGDVDLDSDFGWDYGEDEDDEDDDFDIPATGVHVASQAQITNRYFGPRGGVTIDAPITRDLRAYGGAFGKLYFNSIDGSRRTDTSGAVVLHGAEDLSDHSVTLGGGIKTGLYYNIAPSIRAGLGFEYEYANNTPQLKIDSQTGEAKVGVTGADVYRVRLGIRADF
jgi:hypothetical protein